MNKEIPLGQALRSLKTGLLSLLWNFKRSCLIFSVHFCPRYAYIFSQLRRLPWPKERICKTNLFLDDFEIWEDPLSVQVEFHNTVNVVMRGKSFDQARLRELEGTIFLVNWPQKLNRENVVYATADQGDLLAMIRNHMTPLLFVQGIYYQDGKKFNDKLREGIQEHIASGLVKRIFLNHKANAPHPPISSGLAVIVALIKYSRQIDIYGFDQYQTKEIGQMTYGESLRALSNFTFGGPQTARLPQSYPVLNDVPERAIYSWHYSHRFQEILGIKNYGFLSSVGKHKSLIEKFDKIFYR